MKVLIEGATSAQEKNYRKWLKGIPGVHTYVPCLPDSSHYRSLSRLLPLCRPDLVLLLWGNREFGTLSSSTKEFRGQTKFWVFYNTGTPRAKVALLKPDEEVSRSWLQQAIRAEQANWRKSKRDVEPAELRTARIASRKERQRGNYELAVEMMKFCRETIRGLEPWIRKQRRLAA